MGISFSEPEKLKEIFDGPNRSQWQGTEYILSSLAIRKDDIIADVGAGTGYFSRLFAERVTQGKVYSIDAEPNMVSYMKQRFSTSFENVQVIQSEPDNPHIPADTKLVFIANTYRFIEDRMRFLSNLKSQTSPTTRFVVIDIKGNRGQVPSDKAISEWENAGFMVEIFDEDGCPEHFILIMSHQQ
ncbi:class I SAM-dependent methyltransferase [Vibrio sonorensis]|uniref:class I SAM-dependent methyltransferase n=1 Tax=Vibrio sonorensis TaxID=1004316 RepID=UPI0008DA4AFD|nr:class I SAM-dependent methyltransferase [Vibrio sonorensis]